MLMGIPAIAMFCCGMSSLTSNSRYAQLQPNTYVSHHCESYVASHLLYLSLTFREQLLYLSLPVRRHLPDVQTDSIASFLHNTSACPQIDAACASSVASSADPGSLHAECFGRSAGTMACHSHSFGPV